MSEEHISNLATFSRFFQEGKDKYITFAYSYLRDWTEAEDLFMESMVTLWENRDRWGNDALHPLLLTIIKNKALNVLTHRQIRLRAEEQIASYKQRELDLRISTLEVCEPDKVFDTEIQQIVARTLQQLPEQSCHIFRMSRYDNLPNARIAQLLGLSEKSVEYHITKTLKLLRVALKDYLASLLL